MKPPFQITNIILQRLTELAQLIGQFEGMNYEKTDPLLRKKNNIRTIHSSLAIEGNTLSLEQVTAIVENKRVVGPVQEILEVKNAVELYRSIQDYNYLSLKDFKKAHKILMQSLIPNGGKFRTGNVGIIKGSKVKHIAPKANLVPGHMENLFKFLKNEADLPLPIASAVFHYETEFIHPFEDGNGRMGRFWQHLILSAYHPVFNMIPFETVIRERQVEYYHVLSSCDKEGASTKFIEFSLDTLVSSLRSAFSIYRSKPLKAEDRLDIAKNKFADIEFTRKDYLMLFKELSSATASRDLLLGIKINLLAKIGQKSQTIYYFILTS